MRRYLLRTDAAIDVIGEWNFDDYMATEELWPTKDVGDDTRMFNGVDVNFNVRLRNSFTFSGGTSTGKVENDWCAVRAAVPESYMLNPYCHVESPFQTSFRALASYTIPRIELRTLGIPGASIGVSETIR